MSKTVIKEIGPIVETFKEDSLLVLFGGDATPELREISVVHEPVEVPNQSIKESGTLQIGNQKYNITKVGSDANANYESLGHISIYFADGDKEILPGAIVVSPSTFPEINVGDIIEFK